MHWDGLSRVLILGEGLVIETVVVHLKSINYKLRLKSYAFLFFVVRIHLTEFVNKLPDRDKNRVIVDIGFNLRKNSWKKAYLWHLLYRSFFKGSKNIKYTNLSLFVCFFLTYDITLARLMLRVIENIFLKLQDYQISFQFRKWGFWLSLLLKIDLFSKVFFYLLNRIFSLRFLSKNRLIDKVP